MKTTAIIGAGIAGLTTAFQLKDTANITIFEKSRGVSGRMSTRYAGSYQFDHGAQYFTAETDTFKSFLNAVEDDAGVKEWQGRFGSLEGGIFSENEPRRKRYVATKKMNSLCSFLAEGLAVQLNKRIMTVSKTLSGGYILLDHMHQLHGPYDRVILAIPAPQLQDLLRNSYADQILSLDSVSMIGCYSLMIGDPDLALPEFDGAHVKDSPIGWIAANSRKPQRETNPSMIIQSTNKWAEQHIEEDPEKVKKALLSELEKQLYRNYANAEYVSLHRWRFAAVENALGHSFWHCPGEDIYAIGDWCLGGKVEKAYLSAEALSAYLLDVERKIA